VQKVRESVRSTRDVLRARNTPSQAELRNHECIKLIVDKCEDELSRLQATLPPPPTGDTSLSELQSHVSLMVSHETARYVVKALELCDTVSLNKPCPPLAWAFLFFFFLWMVMLT